MIVRAIPPGRVMTYGSVAALIPPPPGMGWGAYERIRPRWVGYALADCPEEVPWQRVVNVKGQISARVGHGPHIQRALLEEDGVVWSDGQRIDLTTFGWEPDPDWLLHRGLLPPASHRRLSRPRKGNLL
jgi:methylated-DNA-protein-cysteine methyltransferase-like protein